MDGPRGALAIEAKTGKNTAAARRQAVGNAIWAKEKFAPSRTQRLLGDESIGETGPCASDQNQVNEAEFHLASVGVGLRGERHGSRS